MHNTTNQSLEVFFDLYLFIILIYIIYTHSQYLYNIYLHYKDLYFSRFISDIFILIYFYLYLQISENVLCILKMPYTACIEKNHPL